MSSAVDRRTPDRQSWRGLPAYDMPELVI